MNECAVCKNMFSEGLIEVIHGNETSFWCPRAWNQWLDDQLDPSITEDFYAPTEACPQIPTPTN